MDITYQLADLETRYLDRQRALGRSTNTILRYEATFRLFGRFLDEVGLKSDSRALTTNIMQQFAGFAPLRFGSSVARLSDLKRACMPQLGICAHSLIG
jgi:hypothetical protein